MQVDRGSLLLGFVLGLAVAALLMASSVVLSTRQAYSGATAAMTTPVTTPVAIATGRASPTPTQMPTPTPTATAQPTPTATTQPRATAYVGPPALHYDTVDVPARRFSVFQIPAEAGQTLELTVQVDSDIDLTVFTPSGEPVAGPLRVQRTYSLRQKGESGGSWAVKLDNSYSWITGKQVLVQYRLINP